MSHKYLIHNGILLSIRNGMETRVDILVENGNIKKIAAGLEEADAERIDATGSFISIGWLDSHCHFARQGNELSVDLEKDILQQGATYAVDMGSLGPVDYPLFRSAFIKNKVGARAYMNIASLGIRGSSKPVDFEGPQDIDTELILKVGKEYHEEILGLKARIDEKFCFDPIYVMDRLRALGDCLSFPIAVHAPRSCIGIERLLKYLKKGDILCHTLAGNSAAMDILDNNGRLKRCVLEARERGVIFDLSHGTNAYSYETAEAAWRAGFFPDTISSDLHGRNLNGPVFNLANVLSKMRGLSDMPWWQLLNKTIAEPVRLQHIPGKDLEIQEGRKADLTIFKIEEGKFEMLDSKQQIRNFRERIIPVYSCLGEEVVRCNLRK